MNSGTSPTAFMALRELPAGLGRLTLRCPWPSASIAIANGQRQAFSAATALKVPSENLEDIEQESSFSSTGPSEEVVRSYDPVRRAQARKRELPPSRYQFRPPRYYRGPLHPHQPPPTSDPSSRVFVPGPFSAPRLEQTYESTIMADLMTLSYSHKPPGTVTLPKAPRLREWDQSSPYHKNRPKRGPRGGDVLQLIEKDITWQNIPKIKEITVHTMVKGAMEDSAQLHVAGMLLQAITGVRATVHRAKHDVSQWGIRKSKPISLTCTLRGEEVWGFLDKCINIVFPRIKDWPGVKGSSGDSSGNIAWGFHREAAMLFPEVEVNYDMYPPKMIPGFHVLCKTTAKSDRHARLLLSALGIPFYGKYVD